jgi:TonB family protein
MDGQKYSLKDVFRLRIRICLLIVLVVFIVGFIFSPEVKMKVEPVEPQDTSITIIPIPEEEMVNISEIPEGNIQDVIGEEYEETEVEEEPVRTNIPIDDPKKARVEIWEDVIFDAYEVKPVALNLDEVNFEYPRRLIPLGIEGTVYLKLLIDKEGDVREVSLYKTLHPFLDKVAIEKAWQLRFSPAMQRDKPVNVYYSFPVEFKLE